MDFLQLFWMVAIVVIAAFLVETYENLYCSEDEGPKWRERNRDSSGGDRVP